MFAKHLLLKKRQCLMEEVYILIRLKNYTFHLQEQTYQYVGVCSSVCRSILFHVQEGTRHMGHWISAQNPLARRAWKARRLFGRGRGTTRKAARTIIQRGASPQAMYSAKVFGLAPTRRQAIRRHLGATFSARKQGRCLTTMLAIEFGRADPAVQSTVDLANT